MPYGDVTGGSVTPFPGIPSPRRRPRNQPRTPAVITGASAGIASRAGNVLARASWVGAIGSAAWWLSEKVTGPDFDPFGVLEQQQLERELRDEQIREKARATRARVEKAKKEQKAYEAGEIAAQYVIGQRDPYSAPPPPDARLLPGSPGYAKQTQVLVEDARRQAVAAAGGSVPPRTFEEEKAAARAAGAATATPAAATPAATPTAKEKWIARANALIANPFFQLSLLGLPALNKSGGKKRAPQLAPELPPLTGFDPGSVTFGELGGELALEPDPMTETRGDDCESIDPRRTPGECRQGWFSETPDRLYLKEWSRRPCQ